MLKSKQTECHCSDFELDTTCHLAVALDDASGSKTLLVSRICSRYSMLIVNFLVGSCKKFILATRLCWTRKQNLRYVSCFSSGNDMMF